MKIETDRVWGFQFALLNMRLSHDSTAKSDTIIDEKGLEVIGDLDLSLAKKLIKAGPSHSKFLRFIHAHHLVWAPLKWWKHFDTYKYAEKLSSSTMHTIMKRELTEQDFSVNTDQRVVEIVNGLIRQGDFDKVVDTLPDGFIQLRAVDTNYACLRNIYFQRRHHKLTEWKDYCAWIETLPYAELLTLEGRE